MSQPDQNLSEQILDQLLTPDVASRILEYHLPPGVEPRLTDLREKANDGTLTTEEREEYEQLVDALDMLAELRASAREAASRRAS